MEPVEYFETSAANEYDHGIKGVQATGMTRDEMQECGETLANDMYGLYENNPSIEKVSEIIERFILSDPKYLRFASYMLATISKKSGINLGA